MSSSVDPPSTNPAGLSLESILIISGSFVGILSLIVLFSTGSILAVMVLWLIVALILLVLAGYGFIKWADITSSILPPATATATPAKPNVAPMASNAVGSEVFHVSDNQFTYNDAPAVCAAYGAQLATLEQVMDAYNHGAEWCGYGWTVGGMALYPTQKATWTALQVEVDPAKRTACGRPGVNGGYFDPASKFGVNCYGFKPLGKADLPLPPPGTDPTTFSTMVNKFKSALKTFNMAPYSRTECRGTTARRQGRWRTTAPSSSRTWVDSLRGSRPRRPTRLRRRERRRRRTLRDPMDFADRRVIRVRLDLLGRWEPRARSRVRLDRWD